MIYVLKWGFIAVFCCILGLITELFNVFIFHITSSFSISEVFYRGAALTVGVALITLVEKVTGGRKEE